jgi:type IV pilus assembly protein PilB
MPRNDPFSALLVSEGLVSAEQLAEVTRIAESSGKKLHDEIVRLGYAPGDKVMRALAKAHRLKFVDLTGITVEQDVIDLLPESGSLDRVVVYLENRKMAQCAAYGASG